MLLQILRAQSRDEADLKTALERIVDEHWEEREDLDFKGQYFGDKLEFARHASAFANGHGGVIVFGIAEDGNDRAQAFTPVNLGKHVTSLTQILDSR